MIGTSPPDWLAGSMAPDEAVLWTGQPAQGLIFTPALLLMNLVGAVVLLLSFTWNTILLTLLGLFDGTMEGAGMRALSWTLYLGSAAVGAYLLFGTHLTDIIRRRMTRYALTDRAAYRLLPFGRDAGLSRSPILPDTVLTMMGGRYQTILFGEELERTVNGTPVRRRVGFRDLSEALPVYELMLRVREGRA